MSLNSALELTFDVTPKSFFNFLSPFTAVPVVQSGQGQRRSFRVESYLKHKAEHNQVLFRWFPKSIWLRGSGGALENNSEEWTELGHAMIYRPAPPRFRYLFVQTNSEHGDGLLKISILPFLPFGYYFIGNWIFIFCVLEKRTNETVEHIIIAKQNSTIFIVISILDLRSSCRSEGDNREILLVDKRSFADGAISEKQFALRGNLS